MTKKIIFEKKKSNSSFSPPILNSLDLETLRLHQWRFKRALPEIAVADVIVFNIVNCYISKCVNKCSS